MFTPFIPTTGVGGFRAIERTLDDQLESLRQDPQTAANIKYFEENIGSVRSPEDLIADRRLLQVAMTAYGLETEIDKGAMIKRALEEGVASADSFANRLNDARWVAFVEDFGFGAADAGYEVSSFQAAVELNFRPLLTPKPAVSADEFAGYRIGVRQISTVDDLLADPTTLNVMLEAFGVERGAYTDAHFKALAEGSGGLSGAGYAATLADEAWIGVANAMSQLGLGNPALVSPFQIAVEKGLELRGVVFSEDQAAADASDTLITRADVEDFQSALQTAPSFAAFLQDETAKKVALVAFGLAEEDLANGQIDAMVAAAQNGDFSLAENQANANWAAFAKAAADTSNGQTRSYLEYQIEVQLGVTRLEEPPVVEKTPQVSDADLAYFQDKIGGVTSAEDLVADARLLEVALTAFGLENEGKSTDYIKSILEEDPYEEGAFVTLLSDKRWESFAKAFNPQESDGVSPAIMQYEIEDRLIKMGAPAEDLDIVRRQFQFIDSNLDFILFPELMDVTISAFGLPKDTFGNSYFANAILSDPNKPTSFVNQIGDERWVDLSRTLGAFAGASGNVGVPSFVSGAIESYVTRSFEIAVGGVDQDLRLALNFAREIGGIAGAGSVATAGWFEIMGSEPLRQVVDRAFGLPREFAQLELDSQRVEYEARALRLFGGSDPSVFLQEQNVVTALTRFLAGGQSDLTSAPGYGAVQLMSQTAAFAGLAGRTF